MAFLLATIELSGCLSTYAKKAKSVLTLPSGAHVDQAGAVETPGTLVAGWHLMNAKYKSTIVETIASVDQRVRKEL
jgi:hypothetical protein